jgi:hypothetical protein
MRIIEKIRRPPAPRIFWLACGMLATLGCGTAWPATPDTKNVIRHLRADVTPRSPGQAGVVSSAAGEAMPSGGSNRAIALRVADGCSASSDPGSCERMATEVSSELGRAGFVVVPHASYLEEKRAREEAAKRAKVAPPVIRIGAKKEPPVEPSAPMLDVEMVLSIDGVRTAVAHSAKLGREVELGWADSRGSLAAPPAGIPDDVRSRIRSAVISRASLLECGQQSVVRLVASTYSTKDGRLLTAYVGEHRRTPEARRISFLFAVRGTNIALVRPEGAVHFATSDAPQPCPEESPDGSQEALVELGKDLVARLRHGGSK